MRGWFGRDFSSFEPAEHRSGRTLVALGLVLQRSQGTQSENLTMRGTMNSAWLILRAG